MTVPGVASESLTHPSTMTGLSPRVRAMLQWITDHSTMIDSSDMVKVQLDSSPGKLSGSVTTYHATKLERE